MEQDPKRPTVPSAPADAAEPLGGSPAGGAGEEPPRPVPLMSGPIRAVTTAPPDPQGVLDAYRRFRDGEAWPFGVSPRPVPGLGAEPPSEEQADPPVGDGGPVAVGDDDATGERYLAVSPGSPLWTSVRDIHSEPGMGFRDPSSESAEIEVVLDDLSCPPAADPDLSAAQLVSVGREMLRLGQRDDARKVFVTARSRDPADPIAHAYVALAEELLIRDACPGWDPGQVPLLAVPLAELERLSLDPELAALLALVDGQRSFQGIEDRLADVDRVELYRRLGRAVAAGILVVG